MISQNAYSLLAGDDSPPEDDSLFDWDAGAALLPLTAENLRARGAGARSGSPDFETQSHASSNTTVSNVTFYPGQHAVSRCIERRITKQQAQNAKARGTVYLCLAIQEHDSIENVREEIRGWGMKLKEAFPQIELGHPEVRGGRGGLRLEVEALRSEGLGQKVKDWLRHQGFFNNPMRRITYRHADLVIVEGMANGDVRIITAISKATNGRETHTNPLSSDAEHNAFNKLKISFDRFIWHQHENALVEVLQAVKEHPRTQNQWVDFMSWAVATDLTKTEMDVPCRTLAGFQDAVCDQWLQKDTKRFPVLKDYVGHVKRMLPPPRASNGADVRVFTSFLAHLAVLCARLPRQIRWETLDACNEQLYEEVLEPLKETDKALLLQRFSKKIKQQPQPMEIEEETSSMETPGEEGIGGSGGDNGEDSLQEEGRDTQHDGGPEGEWGAAGEARGGGGGGDGKRVVGGGEGEGGDERGGLLLQAGTSPQKTPWEAFEDMMRIARTIPRLWSDVFEGNESFESASVRNRALHVSLRAAIEVLETATARALEASNAEARGVDVTMATESDGAGEPSKLWLSVIKDKFFEEDWSALQMGIGTPVCGVTSWEINPSSFDRLKAVVGFVNLIHTRMEQASDYELLEQALEDL